MWAAINPLKKVARAQPLSPELLWVAIQWSATRRTTATIEARDGRLLGGGAAAALVITEGSAGAAMTAVPTVRN
ncbi:hypothetical protein GCM10009534_10200 [Kribbella sandramycini]